MTLDDFFAQIESAKSELGFCPGEECFYRGQANSEWPLLPSLLRHCRDASLSGAAIRDLEATLFYEFQARARGLHQISLSGWNTLFFMRHHGLATRLLDWTELLGVALYFAVHALDGDSSPCIWLMNPYALNEDSESWETRDLVAPQFLRDSGGKTRDYSSFLVGKYPPFGWRQPVALYPIQLSDRLHAQRGYFTIHGDDTRPLEEIRPDVVRKVPIADPALIFKIRSYLTSAGIDTHLLFPDLDGLTRYLHEKYGVFQSPELNIYGKGSPGRSA